MLSASLMEGSLGHECSRLTFKAMDPHRAGCRAEDLVLLTKTAAPREAGNDSVLPEVHLLALIDRVEDDERNKGQKIVTALVNLSPGKSGAGAGAPLVAQRLLSATRCRGT